MREVYSCLSGCLSRHLKTYTMLTNVHQTGYTLLFVLNFADVLHQRKKEVKLSHWLNGNCPLDLLCYTCDLFIVYMSMQVNCSTFIMLHVWQWIQ